MSRIEWSEQALSDVAEIVFSAVERLEQFPLSGRVVPEIDRPEVREVIFGNYRIVYLVRGEEPVISIATVFHSARILSGSDVFGSG